MRMEQRLTPQMIQSMNLLQKPVTELEAHIASALENNAALELAEPDAAIEVETGSPPQVEGKGAAVEEGRRFQRIDRFAREANWDRLERTPRRYADGEDPKSAALANTAGREESLQDQLSEQWSLMEMDAEARRAGAAIIARIDPDGYLRVPLLAIAEETRPRLVPESLEKALPEIQKLDPPGVGARDTVECLLLQIERLPGDNQIERTIVRDHFQDWIHNRLPSIAKATEYSLGEIIEAVKVIRSSLHLHPGHLAAERAEPPIRPDVIVDYADTGGGLTVRLAKGNAPRLRIREEVVALSQSRNGSKDEKDFARKHVEEAEALIEALRFRENRLLEISRVLVEKQREFFDVGPSGLKSCRMRDLADELHCDPSTISRTVAGKYVQTPRGVFPLRYFFMGSVETDDGEEVGWDSVRLKVKQWVESEDRKAPLSDDQLADRLKKEGIDLSRRTIAKYRKQLNIPTAKQRRVF